ncbi:hypothetical protein [Streptomyces sp. AA1529]|uniref:hypothetical protein n=1 Tax=Streptomyces sp. AA1529 TaxID=1203257 RepID=UPI003D730D5F
MVRPQLRAAVRGLHRQALSHRARPAEDAEPHEAWGRSRTWGTQPLPDGRVYNQALEDAAVLARFADPAGDPAEAPARFTRHRLPRTAEIVRRSARASRATTLTGAASCLLRDAALVTLDRLAPAAALRAFAGIADRRPPPRTYAAQSQSAAQ